MLIVQVIIAFLTAAVIMLLLFSIYRTQKIKGKEKPSGYGVIFLLMFLITWAGGLWIEPFGPNVKNVPLLPFILSGFFVLLLLVVFRFPVERKLNTKRIEKKNRMIENALRFFYWLLIIAISSSIITWYLIFYKN